MADTGAPWNIPYIEPADIVRDYPASDEAQALAIAAGLSAASNAGIGSNVVQAVKTNTFDSTSSSYVNVPDLSATITPTSATSKILVIANVVVGSNLGTAFNVDVRINGGNASDYVSDAHNGFYRFLGITNQSENTTAVYLDSPGVATATTYDVQVKRGSGAATVFVNRSADGNWGTGASSLTLIEVAV